MLKVKMSGQGTVRPPATDQEDAPQQEVPTSEHAQEEGQEPRKVG